MIGRGLWTVVLAVGLLVPAGVASAGTADGAGCDFDGDGFDDLAVGVPAKNIGANADAGAVNVIYGSGSGLDSPGDQLWSQKTDGVKGSTEAGDLFGSVVDCGDFDDDGFDDLAVGVPFEDVGGVVDAGSVQVFYGSAAGLTADRDRVFHRDSSGVKGTADQSDNFGLSLTVGDFDGDGKDDLAVGVPRDDADGVFDAGSVQVLYGTNSGLSAAGDQIWHRAKKGVIGAARASDQFGRSLTAGDFDGDGRDDLGVGVPFADIDGVPSAGSVQVIYGTNSGLSAAGDQVWHQNKKGIEGDVELSDAFGRSVGAGDFDGDGKADLAVGVPGETSERPGGGGAASGGGVAVIYGTSSGLGKAGNQIWTQNSPGIAGAAKDNEQFGSVNGNHSFT